jgi:hypothetical protein
MGNDLDNTEGEKAAQGETNAGPNPVEKMEACVR